MNNKSHYIYNVLSLYLDKIINCNVKESNYDMEYYRLLKQTRANLVMLSVSLENSWNFQLILIVDKVKQLIESILKEVKGHVKKRLSCISTHTCSHKERNANVEKVLNVKDDMLMNQLYKEFCGKYYKHKLRFIDINNNSECNIKHLFTKCISNHIPYHKWEQFIISMFKKKNLLCSSKPIFTGHSSHFLTKLDTVIDEISEEYN